MRFRLLVVSDTHLGFDLPFRPRVARRRRGPDFFKNFNLALEPVFNKSPDMRAMGAEFTNCPYEGSPDAVVHCGDLLFRSKVPPQLVQMAFEPLIKVADTGTPVYLVPGNHERSAIPYPMLAAHPNIHIFDTPRTFVLDKEGVKLALVGFPYVRKDVRSTFPEVLAQTRYKESNADARVLCMHHCVEGATLIQGSTRYTFRNNHDVIRLSHIPPDFAAVLNGHIHRFQVLTRDLKGNSLAVPVLYPGSIERTSFQEKDEEKGFLTVEIAPGDSEPGGDTGKGILSKWLFHTLPARPMIMLELQANGMDAGALKEWLQLQMNGVPEDGIVKIRITGTLSRESLELLSASSLRALTPQTMNLTVTLQDYRKPRKN
ncbi:MAG: hypothetical protein GY757_20555 [bacterium]|nr:hypothetical protein [bacterium]